MPYVTGFGLMLMLFEYLDDIHRANPHWFSVLGEYAGFTVAMTQFSCLLLALWFFYACLPRLNEWLGKRYLANATIAACRHQQHKLLMEKMQAKRKADQEAEAHGG